MGTVGKIFVIVIILFFGVFILLIVQKASGSGMGFFGLFGVALLFVIKSLFNKDKSKSKDDIAKKEDGDITLKK